MQMRYESEPMAQIDCEYYPHTSSASSQNSTKLFTVITVIFTINVSHWFTLIPHRDSAKSPWNSTELLSVARVIFTINLSHGFTKVGETQ